MTRVFLSTQTLAVDDMERRSDKDDDIVDSEAVAVRKIILASGLCRCACFTTWLLSAVIGSWLLAVVGVHNAQEPETGDRWVIIFR
jgi:hypothetical protein